MISAAKRGFMNALVLLTVLEFGLLGLDMNASVESSQEASGNSPIKVEVNESGINFIAADKDKDVVKEGGPKGGKRGKVAVVAPVSAVSKALA
jgi:hypothetical protein